MIADDITTTAPPGRTTTALDDRLIRALAPLPWIWVAVLSLATYAGWGLVLPLLLTVSRIWWVTFNTEGAVFASLIVFVRLLPTVERRVRNLQLQQTTNLRQLSASEFEQLVGELFRLAGWHVTETGAHGEADGNIDLRLHRGSRTLLVQCKRWTSAMVGVDEVRKLGGTLLRERLSGSDGILVTSSSFTPAAVAEAHQLNIDLVDGKQLVARLERHGATDRLSQPRPAWSCPKCASPMILAKSDYGWWLRCPNRGSGCDGKQHLGKDDRLAVERNHTGG